MAFGLALFSLGDLRSRNVAFLENRLKSPTAAYRQPSKRRTTECRRSTGKSRERKRGDGRRSSRVGELIRHEISPIVEDAFADVFDWEKTGPPVVVSVDDVICSQDLRNARVNISVLGNEEQKKLVMKWLKESQKSLRFELAQCIHMKYVPELIFGESETASAAKTVDIIDMLAYEREEKAKRAGGVAVAPAPDQLSIHDDLSADAGDGILDDEFAETDVIGPSYLNSLYSPEDDNDLTDSQIRQGSDTVEDDGARIVDLGDDDEDFSELSDDNLRKLLFNRLDEEDAKLI